MTFCFQPRSQGLSSPHPRGARDGEMRDPGNEVVLLLDLALTVSLFNS